jgi:hypothetical protein
MRPMAQTVISGDFSSDLYVDATGILLYANAANIIGLGAAATRTFAASRGSTTEYTQKR